MDSRIFRKKSIESINSPEDLDSFLRITNPPVWFALAAIILLLTGVIVWSVVGTIDSKSDAVAFSSVCYISEADVSSVGRDTEVLVDGEVYHVLDVSSDACQAQLVLSDYAMSLGGFENGETVYQATLDRSVPSGTHNAQVVTESISPIRFLTEVTN